MRKTLPDIERVATAAFNRASEMTCTTPAAKRYIILAIKTCTKAHQHRSVATLANKLNRFIQAEKHKA